MQVPSSEFESLLLDQMDLYSAFGKNVILLLVINKDGNPDPVLGKSRCHILDTGSDTRGWSGTGVRIFRSQETQMHWNLFKEKSSIFSERYGKHIIISKMLLKMENNNCFFLLN